MFQISGGYCIIVVKLHKVQPELGNDVVITTTHNELEHKVNVPLGNKGTGYPPPWRTHRRRCRQ